MPHIIIANSQQQKYDKLRKLNFTHKEIESAFAEKPVAVVCIDERARLSDKPVIGLAGTGVLFTDKQRAKFLENVRAFGLDISELEFTQHESCGACGLYCKDHPENTPDEMAEKSAKHMAKSANAKKTVTRIGWTSDCHHKAVGHSHAHHARAIYVDGTGRFNPAKLGLPDGFILSVKYSPDDEYSRKELAIAQSIAMGEMLDLYPGLVEVLELPYNG
jgi:hypothetical protein